MLGKLVTVNVRKRYVTRLLRMSNKYEETCFPLMSRTSGNERLCDHTRERPNQAEVLTEGKGDTEWGAEE